MESPKIGDNCYIGAGAKIIGNVVVGNNVRIGANAVVVEDIPDNSVVVMEKPKIIQKEEILDNRFFSWVNGKRVYWENGEWKDADKEGAEFCNGCLGEESIKP